LKHTIPVITDTTYKLIFIPLAYGHVLPKTTFEQKLAGGWARGASQIFWDPLLISATIEVSNFKFGTERGFGECVTSFSTKLGGAGCSAAPQKLCGPGTMYLVGLPRNSYRNVIKPEDIIYVKSRGLYTSEQRMTHLKLQKLQKGDVRPTQQHIDT